MRADPRKAMLANMMGGGMMGGPGNLGQGDPYAMMQAQGGMGGDMGGGIDGGMGGMTDQGMGGGRGMIQWGEVIRETPSFRL